MNPVEKAARDYGQSVMEKLPVRLTAQEMDTVRAELVLAYASGYSAGAEACIAILERKPKADNQAKTL